MKQIFTLLTASLLFNTSQAQVVLNELYPEPGSGNHEFFELYNTSTSPTPISLDGYTIISYFETDVAKGFYVLDLPNLSIGPKSYFVGSAESPFNFQGLLSSTRTQFSWNNIVFMATNNGYLKKWVAGNVVPAIVDGNANYDEAILPVLLNDFFNMHSGGGVNYNAFIYKNGILINALFGGAGGSTSVPSYITAMPKLNVGIAGGADFVVNFPNYNAISAEFVGSGLGTDNGFIRKQDGLCGSWSKSSAGVNHTPELSNGFQSGVAGSITTTQYITKSGSPSEPSKVTYQVVAAPTESFPITMDVYIDNGSIEGELDATDVFLATNTATSTSSPAFSTNFLPYDEGILITIKTSAGCFDKVMLVGSKSIILPIHFIDFSGKTINNKSVLSWSVSENETGNHFEVEKSTDGIQFSTAGVVFTSEKSGVETYRFTDAKELQSTTYYRLKAFNKDNSVSYSKLVKINAQVNVGNGNIQILQNPVASYLQFDYNAPKQNSARVSIYSMSGGKLYSEEVSVQKGSNTITVNIGGRIYRGIYIVEVSGTSDRSIAKFIKQ